jgi:hypothetical protein
MINSVYKVDHSYELNQCDETKFIGVFSSYDMAQQIVEEYKKLPGFKDHPNDFYIQDYDINVSEWREGFVTIQTKKKIKKSSIDRYIKNKSLVKLYYFGQEHRGQILYSNENFIFFNQVNGWHFDGFCIYPMSAINKVQYGRLEKFQEKLIQNNNQNMLLQEQVLSWLELSSWNTIFKSIEKNYDGVVCFENASMEDAKFEIGKIEKFNSKYIAIQHLNIYGKFKIKIKKIPVNEITCILFNDEYSSTLFNYCSIPTPII